ncbi:MAG: hypothetical protein ACJAVK_001286 [Akkermansiaceae bacterium]|jgi:hypothetical protein
MSLRLEMLQVARLAPSLLGAEASQLVDRFIRSQQNSDGGFCDRDGKSDLYYTSFAVDALTALQVELPVDDIRSYLMSFGVGESLDFVHLCCLSRIWSAIEKNGAVIDAVLNHLERKFRTSKDGGYNQTPGATFGSCYGSFLAYGAYSDQGRMPPEASRIIDESLTALASSSGAWSNDRNLPVPNLPATAAAVSLYRNFRAPIPAATANWILGLAHDQGGFKAFPDAPLPDLLSTAVGLHALDGLQVSFQSCVEPFLDFVDSLWTAAGGFHGTWNDEDLDLEYTYYGLLALGHLSM